MDDTVEPLLKDTPEVRTPLLYRTFHHVPKVSTTEGFHCTASTSLNSKRAYTWSNTRVRLTYSLQYVTH